MSGYIKNINKHKNKNKNKKKTNTITMSLQVKDEKNFKNYKKIWKKKMKN